MVATWKGDLFKVTVRPVILVGIFMTWAFQNTRAGMVVRIVGDSADAARAMGLRINIVRLAATATGSASAWPGGVWLVQLIKQLV